MVDDLIDNRDALYGRLRLWRDANHNGISEREELSELPVAGLLAVTLDYKASGRHDGNGNEYRLKSQSQWVVGGQTVTRPTYDVWLAVMR